MEFYEKGAHPISNDWWMKKISSRGFYDPRSNFGQTPAYFAEKYYGKTIHWFPSDHIERYQEHLSDAKTYKLLEQNGWIDKKINYHINKQGFRHDGTQPDITSEKGGVIWLGDSNTFGTGIEIERTWPWICHHSNDLLKDLRYINFGCPGYGIDTFYRLLKYYIDDVKPNYVIMTTPWITTRSETYGRYGHWEVVTPHEEGINKHGDRWGNYIFSDHSAMIRWLKNLDAIKWLCHQHNATFFCPEDCDSPIVNKFSHHSIKHDYARDLIHPGYENNKYNADIMNRVINDVFKT